MKTSMMMMMTMMNTVMSAVWSPHRIDLVNKLEDVQRRFTRKLNGLANLPYAKRLEILGLDALQTRRIKSDLVHCYSIVYGHSCMKPGDFFVLHSSISTSITRGHNFKWFKPQCSLDVRKYSFAYRVILSISGTACQVILLMLVAFLHLNTN